MASKVKIQDNGAPDVPEDDPIAAARARYEDGKVAADHEKAWKVANQEAGWHYVSQTVFVDAKREMSSRYEQFRAMYHRNGYEWVNGPVKIDPNHYPCAPNAGNRREYLPGDPNAEIWRVPVEVHEMKQADKAMRAEARRKRDDNPNMAQARQIAALIRSGAV